MQLTKLINTSSDNCPQLLANVVNNFPYAVIEYSEHSDMVLTRVCWRYIRKTLVMT